MVFGIIGVAIAVWLAILAVAHLVTRYDYSARSRLALAGLAVLNLVLVRLAISTWWPSLNPVLSYALTILLAAGLFLADAVIMVEAWRRALYPDTMGAEIAKLRRDEQSVVEELTRLMEQAHDQAHARGRAAEERSRREGEVAAARKLVDLWQQGGGAARVRSIKVDDWRSELRSLPTEELAARRRALEAELDGSGAERDRAEQIRVQLALADIELYDREKPDERRTPSSDAEDMTSHRRNLEQRLAEIRHEIEWRRRRAQESRQKKVLLK